MRTYYPDRWVIVDTGICIKVFASWRGGFSTGDSWKLSSGTISISEDQNTWVLPQHSGSEYVLHKESEGTFGYTWGILSSFISQSNDQIKTISIEQAIQLLKEGNR